MNAIEKIIHTPLYTVLHHFTNSSTNTKTRVRRNNIGLASDKSRKKIERKTRDRRLRYRVEEPTTMTTLQLHRVHCTIAKLSPSMTLFFNFLLYVQLNKQKYSRNYCSREEVGRKRQFSILTT